MKHSGGRHTKNLQGERKGREGTQEREGKVRGEKGKKGRGEEDRKMYYNVGVKAPLGTVKKYKRHGNGGQKTGKRPKKRQERLEKV